ncbi:MAG TPA: molecular chaperone DnaJ [Acidimicrobiales bacterium]|nr:molecular chaperone DnaJ [Acidimicrobiales bacterium]
MADHYATLGVARDASAEEIKKAYRRLARQLHPDANPGDPDTEAKFKEVARAYETLSDPERRRRYDTFGDTGSNGGGSPFDSGGFGDIFEAFFGGGSPFGGGQRGPSGPARGPDLEVVARIGFEEAVFGCQHEVTVRTAVACATCEATGAAPGTSAETCSECGGAGQVRRVRQSILGQMVTAGPCSRCAGTGRIIPTPCADCHGEGRIVAEKTYNVDIPAGVDTGSTLRLSGRGAVGARGGGAGDLYVHLEVEAHDRFQRVGDDLVHDLAVSVSQAALGSRVVLATLDGDEDLLVPRGAQPGRVFRLRGRGVPRVDGRGRGDLLVRLAVAVPTDLTEAEEDLLRQLAELRGEEVATDEEGFFSRIRSAFK